MYKFRNFIKKKFNLELLVYKNMKGIVENINPFDYASDIYTEIMKTQALREALDKFKFDFSFGGARRDEEKSRAKERVFSLRNSKHSWDPKDQRPKFGIYIIYKSKIIKVLEFFHYLIGLKLIYGNIFYRKKLI